MVLARNVRGDKYKVNNQGQLGLTFSLALTCLHQSPTACKPTDGPNFTLSHKIYFSHPTFVRFSEFKFRAERLATKQKVETMR